MTFAPSSTNGRACTKPTNVDDVCGVLDRVPRAEGARDRGLELLRRDARDAGVGDEVADGKLAPAQALGPVADARAELEIRPNRSGEGEGQNRGRHQRARPRAHFAPLRAAAITSRTRAPNASNGSGRRSTSAALDRLGLAGHGRFGRGARHHRRRNDHPLPRPRIDPDAEHALIEAEDVGQARRRPRVRLRNNIASSPRREDRRAHDDAAIAPEPAARNLEGDGGCPIRP